MESLISNIQYAGVEERFSRANQLFPFENKNKQDDVYIQGIVVQLFHLNERPFDEQLTEEI